MSDSLETPSLEVRPTKLTLFLVVWTYWGYKYFTEPRYGIISLHAEKELADKMMARLIMTQDNENAEIISKDEVHYDPHFLYRILTLEVDEIYKDFTVGDKLRFLSL